MQPFDVTRVTEYGGTPIDDYLCNDPGPYRYVGVKDDEGNTSGDLRWYVNWVKGETARIEWMSPAEYLRRCNREDRRGTERTEEIAERMRAGEVFGMPWYSEDGDKTHYLGSSQEGAHRAAAVEMLGVESIPVVVIRDFPKGAHIAHATLMATVDESSWSCDGELLAYELYDSPHSTDCMFAGYVMPTGREWECTIYGDGGGITKRMTFPGLFEAKVYVELMAPQNERVGYAAECTIEKGIANMGNLSRKNGNLSKVADATVGGRMSIPAKVEAMSYDGTLTDYELYVRWTIDMFEGGSNVTEVRVEDIAYELVDELIRDASGDDVADLVRDVAADNDIVIDDEAETALMGLVTAFDSDAARVHQNGVLGGVHVRAGSLDPNDVPEYPDFVADSQGWPLDDRMVSRYSRYGVYFSFYSYGYPVLWKVEVSEEPNGDGLIDEAVVSSRDHVLSALHAYVTTGALDGSGRRASRRCFAGFDDVLGRISSRKTASIPRPIQEAVDAVNADRHKFDDDQEFGYLASWTEPDVYAEEGENCWYIIDPCEILGCPDYEDYGADISAREMDMIDDILASASSDAFVDVESVGRLFVGKWMLERTAKTADVDNVQIVMNFGGANDSWYYYFRYRCPEWRKYDGVFAKIEQVNGRYQWIVVDSIEYRKLGEGISDNMLDATDACMEAFSEGVLMKGASRSAAVEPMQFEYKGYEKDEDIELWLSVDSEYSITLDWNTHGTGYELCRESDGEFLGRYEFDEFDDVSKRQAWSDAVMCATVDQIEQTSGVKLPRDYWGNPVTGAKATAITAAHETIEISEGDRMSPEELRQYGFTDAYDMSGKFDEHYKVFIMLQEETQKWVWVTDYGDGPEEMSGESYDTAQEAYDEYVTNYLLDDDDEIDVLASNDEDSFALDPRVPDEVDSQKNNQTCPFCGSDSFDGEKCSVCGYEVPPEGFDDIEIDDKDEREDSKDEEESEDEDDAEEDDDE